VSAAFEFEGRYPSSGDRCRPVASRFAATDVGDRQSGVPSVNEETFAVHVLVAPFLHPRPLQSSVRSECGLERHRATLEVRKPVRPRIDVVRRRAVNAAADRVTACAPTVGRDTSASNAPTAIAKSDESRHLGGRRTKRADTDVVRDSSEPLYVGGGGVIHSQRTDESVCAHSAGSAMADCPQRDRANGPRDQEEKHRWSSAMSHSIIVGLARLRRHPPTRRAGPAFANVTRAPVATSSLNGLILEGGLQRERMRILLITLAMATAALTAASSAAAVAAFVTPHKAAYCGISEGEPPLSLICWRPADGLTLDMRRLGRAHNGIQSSNRAYFDPAPGRQIRIGQKWRFSGWACVSRSAGLTCTNRSGHGWWLGRLKGFRLF